MDIKLYLINESSTGLLGLSWNMVVEKACCCSMWYDTVMNDGEAQSVIRSLIIVFHFLLRRDDVDNSL